MISPLCALQTVIYADHTVLNYHGKPTKEVAQKLMEELQKAFIWFKNSCITQIDIATNLSWYFEGGLEIKNISEFKHLGVLLDT